MRPVTDKFKVSHSKLAYIIDSTAAPVCIIAPISSWAAAVSGQLEGDGLVVFIKTIPFNLYALLTILMVFSLCYLKIDFGKMKKNELIAETTGDLHAGAEGNSENSAEIIANPRGKVHHLVIPVIILIICCIGGMLFTGFFYNWGSSLEMDLPKEAIVSTNVSNESTSIILENNADVIGILGENEVALGTSEDGLDYYYSITPDNLIEVTINKATTVSPGETVNVYAEIEPS